MFSPRENFLETLKGGTPGSLFPEVYDIISDEIDRYNRDPYSE